MQLGLIKVWDEVLEDYESRILIRYELGKRKILGGNECLKENILNLQKSF